MGQSKLTYVLAIIGVASYVLLYLLMVTKDCEEARVTAYGATITDHPQPRNDPGMLHASVLVDDTVPLKFYHEVPARKNLGVVPETHSKERGHDGYILSLKYSDQQTAALKNLLSLQCWASSVDAAVVEPSLVESQFATPLQLDRSWSQTVSFSDIFDVEEWNTEYVTPQHFYPLARFDTFLRSGPKQVIYVHIIQRPVHDFEQSDFHPIYCQPPQFRKRYQDFLTLHNLDVVREVCISLGRNAVMNNEQFRQLVFAGHSNVTVIFQSWRGISLESDHDEHTITIKDSQCSRRRILPHAVELSPSLTVLRDAQAYIRRYLKAGSFIAIMVRLEYAVRYLHGQGSNNVEMCLHAVLTSWHELVQRANTTATFLAADVGRFGSYEFQVHKDQWKRYNISETVRSFIQSIYGTNYTVKKWEDTFSETSGTTNRGYIAMLQKAVAVRGKCLLVAGGGSFQLHALKLYRSLHPMTRCQVALHHGPCRVTVV